ncbi:phage holin family protein [Variovorax sp. Sphag1AA]|uniref:phage holin family protein n=1 Tax=Variovorax sp. Sphag1AA TaxID=2587027 RepID=UPI001613DFFE|nr:phage holin family protein [Variovorax sp. Sphag1AA]MBB3176896.1 putative membrane protein YqjE [Variovorax sp. Sphag1AA]
MRLSSLFGIKSQLRRLRILIGEGALAAEDRAELLRFAWEDEKKRLRWMLGLVIAVVGLTTIAIALLSVAIVVHFWDTPYRSVAAWLVAAVWVALWLTSVVALLSMSGKSSSAFEPVLREFERDRAWLRQSLGKRKPGAVPREPRPHTREELLLRIEKQRVRIATLEAASTGKGEAPVPNESPSAAAIRIAREHPVAAGVAAAAVVAVLGPRRIVRWASVIVPVLWRMR